MLQINIKIDIEKDAWNWWEACNKISHGVDWKQRIPEHLRKEIAGKTQAEAYLFLLPFLKKFYAKNDALIKKYITDLENLFKSNAEKIERIMVKITKNKLYRNDFTCFLTSFPRSPYSLDKGYIWLQMFFKSELCIQPEEQLTTFIHELLHFQFFTYFGEKVWNELGKDNHAKLKEAMTVIINDEFKDIIKFEDKGYKAHKNLRAKLIKIWREENDMDKFINKAIELF